MADEKISELADATALTSTDYLVIVDDVGGTPTTKRLDAADLLTYAESSQVATNTTGLAVHDAAKSWKELVAQGAWISAAGLAADAQEVSDLIKPGRSDKAIVGSATTDTTNDPLILPHDGSHYVYFPGVTANVATTPAPTFTTGDDLDIRAHFDPMDFYATRQTFCGMFQTNQIVFIFTLETNGKLRFYKSFDSDAYDWDDSTVAIPDGTEWFRVTREKTSGDIKFYTCNFEPQAVSDWVQLGTTISDTAGDLALDSTTPLIVGAYGGPSGGSGLSECKIYKLEIHLTLDSAGTPDILFDPNEIDTSTDPDAGQTGWTSSTGEVWTVTRSGTGAHTCVVTRPAILLDGTDDGLNLPNYSAPTFTESTGKHTFIMVLRDWATAHAFDRFWAEGTTTNGAMMFKSAATGAYFRVGGATTTADAIRTGTAGTGELAMIAGVVEDGAIRTWEQASGFTADTTINGVVGAITHGSTIRLGCRSDAYSSAFEGEIFDFISIPGVAMTAAQLDDMADDLLYNRPVNWKDRGLFQVASQKTSSMEDILAGKFWLDTAQNFWLGQDLVDGAVSAWVDRNNGKSMTLIGSPVVTDGLIDFDSSAKYGTGAGETPTITATTGSLSVVIGFKTDADVATNETMWGSRTSWTDGIFVMFYADGERILGGAYGATAQDALLSGSGADIDLRYAVAGTVWDEGLMTVMTDDGYITSSDYTGVGTITHNAPYLAASPYSQASYYYNHHIGALAIFDYALSAEQFRQVNIALKAMQTPQGY